MMAVSRAMKPGQAFARSVQRQAVVGSSRAFGTRSADPAAPRKGVVPKEVSTAEEAIAAHLKPGDMVFIQGIAATPNPLVDAMVDLAKKKEMKGIRTIHMHLEGKSPVPDEEAAKYITPLSLFTGGNLRAAVNNNWAEYCPIFLHEIASLFKKQIHTPDIALVQVSPPDEHGYVSLGTSVDCTRAALQHCKSSIAMINKHMPRTIGDGLVHISYFDTIWKHDKAMYTVDPVEPSAIEKKIGSYIAELIPDGATLQMGIGNIPNAVLAQLGNHKHLGIHTEMFSDGMLPLVDSGVIDNSRKITHTGRTVTSFLLGSQNLYNYVDNNPGVEVLECEYTNAPSVIAKCPQMHAINSCIEVDLTGQAASDSIGTRIFSGFGGQVDFLRGAAMSDGGKPILALPSRSNRGDPRIVPTLRDGAGVVSTRATVHYVVTEYGVAFLPGKGLPARAKELIKIAHPDDREALQKKAHERFGAKVL